MTIRFLGLTAIAIALLGACSSSSSTSTPPPCNQSPFECGAGQTCWPKDNVPTFACLNSGTGQKGDACFDTVGAPTCGDGLGCFQQGPAGGACLAYCDPTSAAHACASGEVCSTIVVGQANGPQIHLCVPTRTGDAGADASANDASSDSSSDASSHDATAD